MPQPHISLSAEKIGSLFGIPITNSILMTWMTMLFLTVFSLMAVAKISLVPSNIQSMAEVIIDGLYNIFKSVVGEHYIKSFFPLLATIFLFIAVANWGGLLPGVGTIGFHREVITEVVEAKSEFIPLFRGATADLNTTLALAIIAVLSIQYFGVRSLGGGYFKKFFNFSDPIMFGVGLLEIVSEISRVISFAFRLFGNIFAGEVLLTVIAFLMPLIAPLPFLGLELFVGFIQALVFSMLTAVFLNMATVSHDSH
ncbi:ATP synthase F0 subunit A [Candidatus Gottesmanbacteria bacterium RIFCSPLOWO2_01_FULL_39_12b]|uniref:ATP synthase subunit a n=1 Tax=Candidatus Gottesmanbacteria bacterium RIFCSPLOWO2_01_FULL_39_12b TaxID=1798388 RepID=A0A1F6AQ69_9BACT|nr:MAG: ATP synthase F0 subunit A [Candidatus Gottesmanbacteria bacterium RIFCSPLOWO2_01_FULL_39_12b]